MTYDDEDDNYKKHRFRPRCSPSIGFRKASEPEVPFSLRDAPDGQNLKAYAGTYLTAGDRRERCGSQYPGEL